MPTSSRSISIGCALLAAGAGALALFGFGPLDPPNGPITPTYKTLSEVEPRIAINAENTPGDADSVYRITAVGSYYLADSFTAPSGRTGIEIVASNVTVDLNGMRVGGQNGSLDGITISGVRSGVTIRNGVIFFCGGDGIDAADDSATRIQGVSAISNAGQGIAVGASGELTNCIAEDNGGHGINGGNACRVRDCTATDNGGIGIDVDDDSSVRDCIASGSGGDGISTGDGCTVSGCTASSNTGNGINTADACIVSGSVGRLNGGIGVDVDNGGVVQDSAARDNAGDGITANNGCVITACAAGVNQSGIGAATGASISGCTTYANRDNGIEFGSYSFVFSNNTFDNDSGAGLHTAGDRSRVDENLTTGNAVGMVLDGGGCDVHRNGVHLNQEGVIGDGNDFFKWEAQLPWNNIAN